MVKIKPTYTKTQFNLIIDREVMTALREWCKSCDIDYSAYIEHLVIQDLNLDVVPTRRKKVSAAKEKAIVGDYIDGMAVVDIADKHGIAEVTIYRLLEKYR